MRISHLLKLDNKNCIYCQHDGVNTIHLYEMYHQIVIRYLQLTLNIFDAFVFEICRIWTAPLHLQRKTSEMYPQRIFDFTYDASWASIVDAIMTSLRTTGPIRMLAY